MSEGRPREVFLLGVRNLPQPWRDAMASGAYAHESTFLALPFILVAVGVLGVIVYLAVDGSAFDLTTTRQATMLAAAVGTFLSARAWDAIRGFGSNGVFITALGVVIRRGGRARVLPRECIGSLIAGSSTSTRSHFENTQTGDTQLAAPIANRHSYKQVTRSTTTDSVELITREGERIVVILRKPKADFYARLYAVRDAWPAVPAEPAPAVPHGPLLGSWVRFFVLGALALVIGALSAPFVQPVQHRVAFDFEAVKVLCPNGRVSGTCLTDTTVKNVTSYYDQDIEGFLRVWGPVYPRDPSVVAARGRLTQSYDASVRGRWEFWSRAPAECKSSPSEHIPFRWQAEQRDKLVGSHLYDGVVAAKDICEYLAGKPVPR